MPDRSSKSRLEAMPRFPLAHLPTPLDLLKTPIPGFSGRIFIKRDDCTGFAMGGNKGRKLEFTVGDALAKGASALVTASGVQSNHIRQTAAAAARAGLRFHAIVTPNLAHYPRDHVESGNVLLDMLFNAEFHLAPSDDVIESVTETVMADLHGAGERPYLIPLGASDGIGSLGYVNCAEELHGQCRGMGIDPAAIFLATGSGGTHGGLLAGLRLAGWPVPVIGISVSELAEVKRQRVRSSIDGVGQVLRTDIPVREEEIIVYDDYVGGGYGHPTEGANSWILEVARHDGLLLDQVYTGKAFDGMADILARESNAIEGDVIFLHTGGTPALFAEPRLLAQIEVDAPALKPLYGAVAD